MSSAEAFEAAGLFDPKSDRPDRVELLVWLEEQGFTISEMQQAQGFGGLGAMAADRRLLGGPLLGQDEVAELAGLSPQDVSTLAAALGIVAIGQSPPGELGLTAVEAEALGIAHATEALFSPEEGRAFTRVLGSSIGRIGDAAVSSFLRDIEAPHLRVGGSDLDLAKRGYEAVANFDAMLPLLDAMVRRHAMQAIDRARRASIDDTERYMYRYAIGFVDLVGFTRIADEMTSQELSRFLATFEGSAHDVVTEAGARVVKFIGDEVMFVAIDPSAACRAANALMSGFAAGDDRVVPRGGLSYGNVLVRGGDYYGSIVNLAARLADTAVSGELLVTSDMASAADECTFEPAGRRSLKGFAEPVSVFEFVEST